MTAVLTLPHDFNVQYQILDPKLCDVISQIPMANQYIDETGDKLNDSVDPPVEVNILISDSVSEIKKLKYRHAIFINSVCGPQVVPSNTVIFHLDKSNQIQSDQIKSHLVGLINTISQGHINSLIRVQNSHAMQLAWITHGLEEAIIWTNEKFEVLNQTDSAASILGIKISEFKNKKLSDLLKSDEEDLYELLNKRAAVAATEKLGIDAVLPQGQKVHLMAGIKTIAPNRYQINLVDVTLQHAADKRFMRLANYDPVTGLANRGLLFEFLQRAINRSKNSGRLVALLIVNLDHFNRVDDTGLQLSDEVLKTAASRLQFLLHDSDMLARWGGDELALVMEDLQFLGSVSRIAEKIISVYTNPFVIDGQEYYVSPSIGIAVYPEADDTLNGLIQAADTAMLEAKTHEGLNTYRFYQSKLQEDAEQRASIERQLSRALDNNEFELFYQPKVSLEQEKVIGFEALLRWNHEDWRNKSPELYIPIAEKSGLIRPIGDWVLRRACVQMGVWQAHYPQMKECSIAVNVSPKQLTDPYFAGRVAVILAESKLEAQQLEIEITESAVMENPEQAITILNKIHDLGVKISIDDFGTGYSSLSYLKKLPIDCIKIDRSFVIDIGINESTESIIQAILVMSSKLGLVNVAEGIETVEQMAFFRNSNCDVLQGYLFSKPRPKPEIEMIFSDQYPALHHEIKNIEINRPQSV